MAVFIGTMRRIWNFAIQTLQSHHMVVAYNPSSNGRTSLLLGQSGNGLDWTTAAVIGQGSGDDEFSYPAMAWAQDRLWVSYTVDRERIAWQRFRLKPAETVSPEAHP